MPSLLVSVGGTGQHVALAVARLMYLRALPADITCCVLDADQTSALARATRSFLDHVSHERGTKHPLGQHAQAFLVPFDAGAAAEGGGEEGTRFRSLMLGAAAGNHTDREVFDALYPAEEADQDVLKGFYAKPTLGASAFAARQDEVIEEVRALAAHADLALVCGSFIGGTGAGVIPSLVQAIGNPSSWFGAFHLNWLNPPAGGEARVTIQDMDGNMRHGLEYYYQHVRPRLKASLLMGPPPDAGPRLAAQVPTDSETPAFYHVLVARALHYFRQDAVANYSGSVVAYTHDTAHLGGLLTEAWDGGVPLQVRVWTAQRAITLLGYFDPAERPENVKGLKKSFGIFGTTAGIPKGLHKSIKTFCKLAKQDREPFIDDLLADLKHRRETLQRCVRYLGDVFGGLGVDPVAEAVESEPLDHLKRLWHSPVAPPGGADVAGHFLADRLFGRLLDDFDAAR